MDSSKKYLNPNPRATANPLSILVFWWIKDFFRKGVKKDLEVEDLYNILPDDRSEPLGNQLESNWNLELQNAKRTKRKPRLLRAIIKTFGSYFMWVGVLQFILCIVFRVAQPVFLGKVILYFSAVSVMTKEEACMYAAGLVSSAILSMITTHHPQLMAQKVGMRIRIAACSLIYRKILKLSKTAQGRTAAGQIVNLLSNDVSRFDLVTMYLHYIWILPIQTVVVTYVLWHSIALSALVGVGGLFLQTVPVQSYLSKMTSHLRLKIAVRTDERVRLMSEIISGIQVIKMYAWEKPFEKLVQIARRNEIKVVRGASYLRGLYLATMVFSERSSLYITLLSYVMLGHHITAEKVFALAQFFNILQLTMAIFYPQAVQNAAETKVSIKRLENFLLLDEQHPISPPTKNLTINSEQPDNNVKKHGVTINNGSAKWIPGSIAETLSSINVEVKPGELCAIVGPVGAGKSSLLQAILGELPLSENSLKVGGEISYASQEPWLFVGTVRQNILFGQPYNPERYKEVIRVCALKRDLELFPHGDKTVVGERGVSLSGGQRARINLARAVYRDADVYLLDDPLSAVDTHVGKHLYEECISGYLANKTRILVTHQLQYLRDADLIVIINNGRVEQQGTYKELTATKTDFAALLAESAEGDDKDLSMKKQQMLQLSNHAAVGDEEEDDGAEADENMELIAKGKMKTSVYYKYFRAGASIFALILMFLLLIIGQLSASGADYWVTYWTNQEELRMCNDILRNQDLATNSTNSTWHLPSTEVPMLLNRNITEEEFYTSTVIPSDDTENLTSNHNISLLWTQGEESTELHLRINCTEPPKLDTTSAIYIYTAFIVGCIILTSTRSIVFFTVCMTASRILHDKMFASILAATMRFFDTNPSGRVLNRFSKDMGAVDEQLPKAMLECIQVLLVMCGILTIVSIVNYWLLIPICVMGFLFYKVRGMYIATAQDVKRLEGITRSPVFSHLAASLNGLSTIRASKAQEMVQKEFDVHQDLHTSAWFLTLETSTAFGFWLDCISIAFTTVVTFSFLLFKDDIFGGNVGLAISQSLILNGMLQHGMRLTADVVNQMTSVERVLEYTKIQKESDLETHPDKKPPSKWPSKGEIEFQHMSLRYSPSDPPVLKELNFTIKAAQKVGIVGRTGAGKSSLISALFRLARIEGKILVDGIDTGTMGLQYLRSQISIIPQDPVLFSASLRDNLDPFHNYTDEALWRALEDVELKDSVTGLDHIVNEGGSNFSAGQRQLVCLARAIIRNNKILVLDEATANVDHQTDAFIQSTIRKKFKDCTVLTIAHRLNTIMDSDKVLVMDAGRMVEYDHPYLLLQDKDGYFYKMVQQTGKSMAEQLTRVAKEAYENNEAYENSGLDQSSMQS